MTKNSVRHAPYLRNHTSYDCHFWYTCKMITSQGLYFIFSKFWFFRLLRGLNRKKCPKWQRILSVALDNSVIIHHMIVIFGTHLYNDKPTGVFFIFSKCWFFGLLGGWVKGQKMVQNDKKFCPLHPITQEPYIIWLSFIVQICKMIISSGVFFHVFKILIFWVHRGVKEQKAVQNDRKFCLSHSVSQEPYIIWFWFLVHMCKMMISPGNFFIFQNFDFWSF